MLFLMVHGVCDKNPLPKIILTHGFLNQADGITIVFYVLSRFSGGSRDVVTWFAFVLAERAHFVLVFSAASGLEIRVGDDGGCSTHQLTQGLRKGPQPVLHAGQVAVVS